MTFIQLKWNTRITVESVVMHNRLIFSMSTIMPEFRYGTALFTTSNRQMDDILQYSTKLVIFKNRASKFSHTF